jgi:flavodoxin
MKTLITYFSQTGNTEKLARAMHDAIHGERAIMPLKEVQAVDEYDVIFCGFPVQSHCVPGPVAEFIKSIPSGKKLALFTTHGSLRGGQLAVAAIEQAVSLALKTRVIGTFGCRGKVNDKVIDSLMKNPEHKAWAMEAQSAASHPDEADIEDGREFARDMMAKASTV